MPRPKIANATHVPSGKTAAALSDAELADLIAPLMLDKYTDRTDDSLPDDVRKAAHQASIATSFVNNFELVARTKASGAESYRNDAYAVSDTVYDLYRAGLCDALARETVTRLGLYAEVRSTPWGSPIAGDYSELPVDVVHVVRRAVPGHPECAHRAYRVTPTGFYWYYV